MQAETLEGRDGFVGGSEWWNDFADGRRKRCPLALLAAPPDDDRGAEYDGRETRRGCNAAPSHANELTAGSGPRNTVDALWRRHECAVGYRHSALRHPPAIGSACDGRMEHRAGHPGSRGASSGPLRPVSNARRVGKTACAPRHRPRSGRCLSPRFDVAEPVVTELVHVSVHQDVLGPDGSHRRRGVVEEGEASGHLHRSRRS